MLNVVDVIADANPSLRLSLHCTGSMLFVRSVRSFTDGCNAPHSKVMANQRFARSQMGAMHPYSKVMANRTDREKPTLYSFVWI